MMPATAPTMTDPMALTSPTPEQIATRPASMPLPAIDTSGFFMVTQDVSMAATSRRRRQRRR